MRVSVALGTAGVAMAAMAGLSACQNDQSPPPPSSTPSAHVTQPAAAPSSPAGAPAGGAQAQPGQLFQVGQMAVVPYSMGGKTGTLGLTVTQIEQGSGADLASLNLGDKVKGMVPWYIHYTVKNVGTTDLSNSFSSEMRALFPDGTEAQPLYVFNGLTKCPTAMAPSGFTNGQSYQTCLIAIAPQTGAKVVGAEWWGEPYHPGKGVDWGVKATSTFLKQQLKAPQR